jgi:GT2 family glycosyltransferase
MAGSLQLWDGHPGLLDGSGDAYHISGIAWRGLRGKPVGLAPRTGETFAPCAAASLYSAAMFKAAGGFDDRYFAYHEDVDLAFRLRLAGARAIQVQEARVSHVSSGLPGSASSLAVRLGTRNRIWTYVKCMPGWLVWGLAPLHLAAVLVSLARDVRRGRGGAALNGIGEALSGLGPILASRRDVQKVRKARLADILGVLTWSPVRLARGEADVRPWQA